MSWTGRAWGGDRRSLHPDTATGPFRLCGRRMAADLRLGDAVRLKKAHPCGGFEWQVVRLGADVGLVCRTCGRRILLTRNELARRLRGVVGE